MPCFWVVRSGAPWRNLPEYYGTWSTVYSRFRRWQAAGIWDRILKHVSIEPDFESVMIDTCIVFLFHPSVVVMLHKIQVSIGLVLLARTLRDFLLIISDLSPVSIIGAPSE
ncbi:transposase [Paenibacillus sp. DMB20]|uniref:transposase n=1 Tax=Paenibacillus sp. DMB20 TaxID=1642570 RepID=UPI0009E53712